MFHPTHRTPIILEKYGATTESPPSVGAGADAFTTARKFYGAIKNAVKADIPGAAVLYDEMRKRYLRMKRKDEDNNENTST